MDLPRPVSLPLLTMDESRQELNADGGRPSNLKTTSETA
jgi:hypothetical protein